MRAEAEDHINLLANIQALKAKPPAPKAHSLLPLLFLENKRCMHNEERICTEILPETDKTNNSNKLSSSIFLYLQAQAWFENKSCMHNEKGPVPNLARKR